MFGRQFFLVGYVVLTSLTASGPPFEESKGEAQEKKSLSKQDFSLIPFLKEGDLKNYFKKPIKHSVSLLTLKVSDHFSHSFHDFFHPSQGLLSALVFKKTRETDSLSEEEEIEWNAYVNLNFHWPDYFFPSLDDRFLKGSMCEGKDFFEKTIEIIYPKIETFFKDKISKSHILELSRNLYHLQEFQFMIQKELFQRKFSGEENPFYDFSFANLSRAVLGIVDNKLEIWQKKAKEITVYFVDKIALTSLKKKHDPIHRVLDQEIKEFSDVIHLSLLKSLESLKSLRELQEISPSNEEIIVQKQDDNAVISMSKQSFEEKKDLKESSLEVIRGFTKNHSSVYFALQDEMKNEMKEERKNFIVRYSDLQGKVIEALRKESLSTLVKVSQDWVSQFQKEGNILLESTWEIEKDYFERSDEKLAEVSIDILGAHSLRKPSDAQESAVLEKDPSLFIGKILEDLCEIHPILPIESNPFSLALSAASAVFNPNF